MDPESYIPSWRASKDSVLGCSIPNIVPWDLLNYLEAQKIAGLPGPYLYGYIRYISVYSFWSQISPCHTSG